MRTPVSSGLKSRALLCRLIMVMASLCGGCTLSLKQPTEVAAISSLGGLNRREQREGPTSAGQTAGESTTTRPAAVAAVAGSQPSVVLGAVDSSTEPTTRPAGEPVRLTMDSIVQHVFSNSPHMRASREEMTAAEHALQEFRANLSRLEPYVNTSGETFAYPERLDARGSAGEVVGGVQKETFEGAILRLEGGASMSEATYRDAEREDRRDQGSGGLVRARVEVPFVGSRKRQERVISQAFQESQARRARLDYLRNFSSYVNTALGYYLLAVLQQDYAQNVEEQAEIIERILADNELNEEDRMRLVSTMDNSRVSRDQYLTSRRTYILLLLALLGMPMDNPFELVDRGEVRSRYLDALATPEGRGAMIEEAHAKNPQFHVLEGAIKDAELQRQAAIQGRYDVTAFLEGTQFPFGAPSYDDRVGGWLIGGGVNVRLNDQRVLTASRLKAEAQIRQYQAEIEAERLTIERLIVDNSEKLRSYHQIRQEVREIVRMKKLEFQRRSEAYFERGDPGLTIDNVLGPLTEWVSARNRLVANKYYIGLADLQIMKATGELYNMVGMDIEALGAGEGGQVAPVPSPAGSGGDE